MGHYDDQYEADAASERVQRKVMLETSLSHAQKAHKELPYCRSSEPIQRHLSDAIAHLKVEIMGI